MDDIPFAGRGVVYITRWKAEGFLQLVENVPVASRIFLRNVRTNLFPSNPRAVRLPSAGIDRNNFTSSFLGKVWVSYAEEYLGELRRGVYSRDETRVETERANDGEAATPSAAGLAGRVKLVVDELE